MADRRSRQRRGGSGPRWRTVLLLAALVLSLGVGIGVMIGGRLGEPPPVAEAPPAAPAEVETAAVPPPPPPAELPAPDMPEIPLLRAPDLPPARLIAPPLPPPGAELPAWRRNAVAAPAVDGRPMIAIVIDDLGVDRRRSAHIVALPGPLTAAFMSYAPDLPAQTAAARAGGHELLLHMPMEPLGAQYDPGPGVLRVGAPAEELRRRLSAGLGKIEGLVGLNNHMGSKFTADAAGMRVVMEELKRRGLLFLDSLTTGRSVGLETARRFGVPAVARDVFLDNDADVAAIRKQLARTEEVARRHGHAVAIGHPYDGTAQALAEWLPTLKAKGLVLVPLSAIVKRRLPTG